MNNKRNLILAILLPVQIIGISFLAKFPQFVERWYSLGMYPQISKLMRFSIGVIPFSFGDLLYSFLIILLLRWFIKRTLTRFKSPKIWIPEALASLSILYFCFHVFWGFNYYRLPLHTSLEIKSDYTTEQLTNLTKRLIESSNKIHLKITSNDSVKVDIGYKKYELLDKTIKGYNYLSQDFPELTYTGHSLKPSLYSIPLTYMGFNGYLNPLTNEAQVNTQILPYKIPTTASHEVGHQLGYAKENEANFIACLVTMNHPDIYFTYSGYTFALSYCLSELYRRDPENTKCLVETINPGIMKNYQEVEAFWKSHQNPFEPLFHTFYNSFLIVNNQTEGMKSYSYVVALLVNYFDDSSPLLDE